MNRFLMRTRHRYIVLALLALALTLAASRSSATMTLDKPLAIRLQKIDRSPLHGHVNAWDETGFDFTPDGAQPTRVAWLELDAHAIYVVRSGVIDQKDATGWVNIGRDLLPVPQGKSWAEKAFARALRIDPNQRDRIERLRHPAAPGGPASMPAEGADGGVHDASNDPANVESSAGSGGPRVVGTIDQQYWGKLSDEDQANTVERLRKFAESAQEQIQHPLKIQETKFFLFCSDLPPTEAARWASLLDRMYARLAELFGVPRGQNLWRGKALIFVFSSADDYRKFEQKVQNTDPGESAGMTHCFGDGVVSIAFYRQPDELLFAHVLVHESVHGFVHRYRSPVMVPSWANEGLAETIATDLVPDAGRTKQTIALAHRMLVLHGGKLGDFFSLAHIEGWHYSVAESLTTFMIQKNKRGYVEFIDGIKQGLTWQQSLEQHYRMSLASLLTAFAKAMNTPVSEH